MSEQGRICFWCNEPATHVRGAFAFCDAVDCRRDPVKPSPTPEPPEQEERIELWRCPDCGHVEVTPHQHYSCRMRDHKAPERTVYVRA